MGRDLSLPRPQGEEERDLAHARFAEIVRPLERQSNERLNGGGRQLCFDAYRADPERFRRGAEEALEQGAHPVKLLVWMVVEDSLPESGELALEPEHAAPNVSAPSLPIGLAWTFTCSKCGTAEAWAATLIPHHPEDPCSVEVAIPCGGGCGKAIDSLDVGELGGEVMCSTCEAQLCSECERMVQDDLRELGFGEPAG